MVPELARVGMAMMFTAISFAIAAAFIVPLNILAMREVLRHNPGREIRAFFSLKSPYVGKAKKYREISIAVGLVWFLANVAVGVWQANHH